MDLMDFLPSPSLEPKEKNEMSSFWSVEDDLIGEFSNSSREATSWRIKKETTEDGEEEQHTDAPLKALRPSSIKLLSTLLNPIKIIPTEHGNLRDWRGLAELIGITTEKIVFIESKEDPTAELIKIWIAEESRSLSDLKAFLAVIDRYDIWDDVTPLLENDIQFYWNKEQHKCVDTPALKNGAEELSPEDSNVLTVGDEGGKYLTRYDAFILYAEEDSEFAMQIVEKMEDEYNLKICVRDRDLLPGAMFEHEIISRVIEERCNRLLAVFSPNFLKSEANKFLVSYAQALALELRQRKIIPCMYSRCELPPSVRYSFCLVYNRSGKLWNFWDKLSQSIKTTPAISVPEKKISSLSLPSSSSSLPTSPSLPMSLQDSIGWWEPEKAQQAKIRQKSSYSTSDSGIIDDTLLDDFDTMSLQSAAPLVNTSDSSKYASLESKSSKSKWLKKFMSPVKRSKTKKEKLQAEQLLC